MALIRSNLRCTTIRRESFLFFCQRRQIFLLVVVASVVMWATRQFVQCFRSHRRSVVHISTGGRFRRAKCGVALLPSGHASWRWRGQLDREGNEIGAAPILGRNKSQILNSLQKEARKNKGLKAKIAKQPPTETASLQKNDVQTRR